MNWGIFFLLSGMFCFLRLRSAWQSLTCAAAMSTGILRAFKALS